jgi:hypothetical protein
MLIRATTFLTVLLAGAVAPAASQSATGRIVGRVVDAASGEAIPGAQVTIDAAAIAGRTDLGGRYTLLNVPAGSHTVAVRIIGYGGKAVTGVVVTAGAVLPLDISLTAAAVQVAGIEVTAEVEHGSVSRALDEQRAASGIVSGVSREQIQKSPDSDAGQAVQRVSGVTVQEGRYVFVRGLGERYTTTSLNNTRIPSPEPERRVVPLDLFPSGLLQSISTSKTYTPEQPGDFTGAQVDLRTREFPARRVTSVSLSVGANDQVLGRQLEVAPTVGSEWMGAAGGARAIPARAATAGDLSGLSQTDLNTIIGSFRNAWSARRESGRGQLSLGVSTGGEWVALGAPLGYLASFTYAAGQEVRAGERRALAIYGGTPDSTLPQNAYHGSTATATVLWGGLLNLSARLGDATKLSFNNTYTRSGDNQASRLAGQNEEFAETFDVTRLTFTERSVLSSQIAGEHLLGARHGLTWTGTWSQVRRYEPDRSDLVYRTAIEPETGVSIPLAWWGAPRSASRTFSDLDERGLDLSAALALRFGAGPRPLTVKVGGALRWVDRDADTRVFDVNSIGLDDAQRAQPAEAIFGGAYAEAGLLTVFADANAGRYTADDRIGATFAQLEVPLGPHLRLIGGARAERWSLDLLTTTIGGAGVPVARDNTDVLPALALTYDLAASHVVRLSATQTLARPEYRELSPVNYRDVLGGLTVFGNPALERSLIQNFDARWEWYPGPGELLSLGAFAKRFERPIEKVLVATTGANALSFVNADAAYNYGIELEVRKNLVSVTPVLAPFSVFANATLMRSEIRPGNDSISSLTSAERPMVGQAPYVVNAGLLYTSPSGASATLLYNVVGRRIVEAGSFPLPDTYEEARQVLDASLQAPLGGRLTLKLDAKNLLDAPYRVTQGSVIRHRYTAGRGFSAGLSWQP